MLQQREQEVGAENIHRQHRLNGDPAPGVSGFTDPVMRGELSGGALRRDEESHGIELERHPKRETRHKPDKPVC